MGRKNRRKQRMSKIIRMTQEYKDQCRIDFEKALESAKLTDGKISFAKTFSIDKQKATVYFTAEAWTKMIMLLQGFSKEVAWHGVAHRLDTEGAHEYLIQDILVYPQEVTGSTVEMDTEKYAIWLQENDEDERFYNIHMQGHSHVNMSPNPSCVDLSHQEEILAQLGNEDFYIFMIYNKSFNRNIKIYDLQKNILFEDGDVDVKIYDSAVSFDEFIKGAKDMVKDKVPSYQFYSLGSQYGQKYGDRQYGKPYNPLSNTPNPANGAPSSGEKDDKGKKEGKPKVQIGAGWKGVAAANACDEQQSIFEQENGEFENPYISFGHQ